MNALLHLTAYLLSEEFFLSFQYYYAFFYMISAVFLESQVDEMEDRINTFKYCTIHFLKAALLKLIHFRLALLFYLSFIIRFINGIHLFIQDVIDA